MKLSESLMEEINAVIRMNEHMYAKVSKEHLHIADCMLYMCYANDIEKMIGMELKRGDIFIIIGDQFQEQLKLYINKDFRYTEYDKWNFRDDIFLPLEEHSPIKFEYIREKYHEMMGFTVRTLDDSIIDENMIRLVMQKHHRLLVIRKLTNGDEYDRYYVHFFSGIIDSDHLNRTICSCKKGNIVLVSRYTGYGYTVSRSNISIYIGVMDVTQEDAQKLNLKFDDMYKNYVLK